VTRKAEPVYDHGEVERRWQRYWEEHQTFRAVRRSGREKRYILDMFPYPSAAGLHVGHPEGYTATDIVSRQLRMRGYDVLHPMGWDAFGLPAEQHAIRTGTHPAVTTRENIATFKRQLRMLGLGYDWAREIDSTDPRYVRWTQWIFLKLFERGLAYQDEIPVNWCAGLGTVLANEEVVDGKSEVGGFPVVRTPLRQWMLRITAYADRLAEDLTLVDWPDGTLTAQRRWIGRSEGAEVRFVGVLDSEDFKHEGFAGIAGMNLAGWSDSLRAPAGYGRAKAPTRFTPDGSVFVFQSHAKLTEFDNEGVGEIYRYDPAAEVGQRLLCVSCAPSGASPTEDALLTDTRAPFSTTTQKTMVANVIDDGTEVFFQSADRLLPEDANESIDVYEWMANGTAGCKRLSGCLALISSGQGETDSYLYAMSADGRDVFFTTKDRLLGADVLGSPSIYDARVGGGIPESPPLVECEGDACQPQGSEAPALPVTETGGAGEGSPPSGKPKHKRCAKGKRRVKGRCVRRHRHKHHKKHGRRHRRAHAKRGAGR